MKFILALACVAAVAKGFAPRNIVSTNVVGFNGLSSNSLMRKHDQGRLAVRMSDAGAAAIEPDTPPPVVPAAKSSGLWDTYLKTTDTLTNLFPVWTVLFAGLALKRPESFAWFTTKYFTGTLGALMLSMGITLTPEDFKRVLQQPTAVIWGFILCYVMCPLLGLGLGKAFNLPMDLVAGLVLVGCINGGQASNLCTYIAKGDVALSVLMTTVTTVAGIVATPLLCKLLLGAVVPVDAVGIATSCIQVVLAPIIVGMTANRYDAQGCGRAPSIARRTSKG